MILCFNFELRQGLARSVVSSRLPANDCLGAGQHDVRAGHTSYVEAAPGDEVSPQVDGAEFRAED